MMRDIDEAQPESERVGVFLDSVEIPTDDLRVGDKAWFFDPLRRTWSLHEIVGFGTKDAVNGRGFLGKPYAAIYGMEGQGGPEMNPNNYIMGETCRIEPRN